MQQTLGARVRGEIRAELARQGVTQESLAAGTDMSTSALHRRLSGQTELTIGEAEVIAEALGLNVVELVRRANEAQVLAS